MYRTLVPELAKLDLARADNSRKTMDAVDTDKAPKLFSHQHQAMKAGELLFPSQQMAFDSSGKLAAGMARHPNFPF